MKPKASDDHQPSLLWLAPVAAGPLCVPVAAAIAYLLGRGFALGIGVGLILWGLSLTCLLPFRTSRAKSLMVGGLIVAFALAGVAAMMLERSS